MEIRVIGNGQPQEKIDAIQRELDDIVYIWDGTQYVLFPEYAAADGSDEYWELVESALRQAEKSAGYEHQTGGCTWGLV